MLGFDLGSAGQGRAVVGTDLEAAALERRMRAVEGTGFALRASLADEAFAVVASAQHVQVLRGTVAAVAGGSSGRTGERGADLNRCRLPPPLAAEAVAPGGPSRDRRLGG